ncbi:MAG TPA: Ig-like domain-containing protein [Rugosimonospora sp.]|nr:Ig-like domain-containing protein [Rugosimonospora sp.]
MKRRTVLAAGASVATVAAGSLLAGCKETGSSAASSSWNSPGSSSEPSASAGPASLTIAPAADATNVSPADGVVVTVENATVQSVTVTTGSKTVAGALDDSQKVWRNTDPLAFDASYTVTAVAVGADGKQLQQTVTFKTLKPSSKVNATFQANSLTAMKTGGTYGVGQPIILHLSKAPADKAAVVKLLEVTTTPEVEGKWHWIDNQNLLYRPEKYWASGTQVSVKANLLGVSYGKGAYGAANVSTNFTIGKSKVAIADDATHHMKIYFDGTEVKDFPISMGRGGTTKTSDGKTIDFYTRSGVHVVMTREMTHRMTSSSYGVGPDNPNYYDEVVQLCCRISYTGEFVHAAPWSVADQGKRDVSHGCINISTANAQWFYDNFGLGDVVEIKGTPKQLAIWESIGGWDVPWSQWGNA